MTRRLALSPLARIVLASVLGAVSVLEASRLLSAAASIDAATMHEGGASAPPRLVDTGLYEAGRPGVIDARNRPFSPQYPLWSDGAVKRRWVYLPPGSTIDASNADEWEFPVGARFWKEFTFGGRRVETRFMWKAGEDRWVFASYAWNEEGSEALLAPPAGVPDVADVDAGRKHSIPSTTDCQACHQSTRVRALGFNALQLSTDRDPHAIHGEATTAEMINLRTLDAENRLAPRRDDLVNDPPRIRTSSPQTRTVLGYLITNCGACHNGDGAIVAKGFSLSRREALADGDRVASLLVDQRTTWQVPGAAEGESVLIDLHAPNASALLTRMRSRRPSSQMPPLGTVVQDREAVQAITRWIESELPTTSQR